MHQHNTRLTHKLTLTPTHTQAQRTKFAKPLVEKAQRAILLSGTPALSNPAELLTQLQALLPKVGGCFCVFNAGVCAGVFLLRPHIQFACSMSIW